MHAAFDVREQKPDEATTPIAGKSAGERWRRVQGRKQMSARQEELAARAERKKRQEIRERERERGDQERERARALCQAGLRDPNLTRANRRTRGQDERMPEWWQPGGGTTYTLTVKDASGWNEAGMSSFVKTTACYGPQSILYTYVLDAQERGRSLPAPGAPWQNDVGDLMFPLRYGVVLRRAEIGGPEPLTPPRAQTRGDEERAAARRPRSGRPHEVLDEAGGPQQQASQSTEAGERVEETEDGNGEIPRATDESGHAGDDGDEGESGARSALPADAGPGGVRRSGSLWIAGNPKGARGCPGLREKGTERGRSRKRDDGSGAPATDAFRG